MKPKKSVLVLLISTLVGILAISMLNKDFSEIDQGIRLLIALGAAILSAIITLLLFPSNEQK